MKKWCSRLVHFAEMSLKPLKMVHSSLCSSHVFVCCLITSGHAPNEMKDGVLGYLDLGITELLDSLSCKLDQNIMSQRCSIRLRSGECAGHSMVSIPSSSRNCLHTQEPRTHRTSVGSDNGSKGARSVCHCLAQGSPTLLLENYRPPATLIKYTCLKLTSSLEDLD